MFFLISIQITKAKTSQNRAILAIICCLNVRSLNGKVDELAAFMSVHKVHIATVTETWLTDQIGDDQLSIGGYVIDRKDRMHGREGGVWAYVSQQIPTMRFLKLEVSNLECMWLRVRPPRLPRPLSAIVVYVESSIDTIRSKYPDCGIVILGDFNHLNIYDLITRFNPRLYHYELEIFLQNTRHFCTAWIIRSQSDHVVQKICV